MLDNSKIIFSKKKNNLDNLDTKNSLLLFKNQNSENFNVVNKKIEKQNIKRTFKIRNPGIDMIRIVGMFAIVIHHILIHGKVIITFRQYPELKLLNIICFWHVSSFALISGIVGFKTNKYSNLLYLWLCVLFYTLGIRFILKKFRPQWVKNEKLIHALFPVIFSKYWYFTQYFGLYLLLPPINKGISLLTKTELRLLVASTLSFYIIWKDAINPKSNVFSMGGGRSILWLLIFYLTGAYIGKYKVDYQRIKKTFLYFGCVFIFLFSTLLCYKLPQIDMKKINGYLKRQLLLILRNLFITRINSVPMILQAISITLFLMQIKYNKYLSKVITFLGPLTFGIYLFHEHPRIRANVIGGLIKGYDKHMLLKSVIRLTMINGIKIFLIGIIIDYLRHLVFTILRIKKICIFIEKKIYKIISLFN